MRTSPCARPVNTQRRPLSDRLSHSAVGSAIRRALAYVFNRRSPPFSWLGSDAPQRTPRAASWRFLRTFNGASAKPLRAVLPGKPQVPSSGAQGDQAFAFAPPLVPTKTTRRNAGHDDVIGRIDMRHRPLPLTPIQSAFEQTVQPLREAYDKAQAAQAAQASKASNYYVNLQRHPSATDTLPTQHTRGPKPVVPPKPAGLIHRSRVAPPKPPRASVRQDSVADRSAVNPSANPKRPTPAPRLKATRG